MRVVFFKLAIKLANQSPADSRSLICVARDFAVKHPDFATAAGMTAFTGIMRGYGYDIARIEVLDTYAAAIKMACAMGVGEGTAKAHMLALIASNRTDSEFMQRILAHHLAEQTDKID